MCSSTDVVDRLGMDTDNRVFHWKSQDGLNLAGCEWRPPNGSKVAHKIPLLCLPGLSRNTRDFNDIACFLSSMGHQVIALDYRGRGDSEWDPDWRNYAIPIEQQDIDAAIEHLALERFAVLGTSRGGIHALAMAHRYSKDRMAAVIFNDVGPHIEMKALHRIAATLGHNMVCRSFEEVASNLEATIGSQFPGFSSDDWIKLARQLASRKDGEVIMDYDPALAHQLASLDDGTPAPDLWPLFEFLFDRPVLVIRGEHSDLLTKETCQKMVSQHPSASCHLAPGEGHAPVLWDQGIQRVIGNFLASV